MFTGSCVALVTPFKRDRVDYQKLKELVEFQIKGGIAAIVPCGTTGESATLSTEEHEEVIEFVVETVKKRVPVIAGTGSNSTDETISLSRHAQEAGRTGCCWSRLIITSRPKGGFIYILRKWPKR